MRRRPHRAAPAPPRRRAARRPRHRPGAQVGREALAEPAEVEAAALARTRGRRSGPSVGAAGGEQDCGRHVGPEVATQVASTDALPATSRALPGAHDARAEHARGGVAATRGDRRTGAQAGRVRPRRGVTSPTTSVVSTMRGSSRSGAPSSATSSGRPATGRGVGEAREVQVGGVGVGLRPVQAAQATGEVGTRHDHGACAPQLLGSLAQPPQQLRPGGVGGVAAAASHDLLGVRPQPRDVRIAAGVEPRVVGADASPSAPTNITPAICPSRRGRRRRRRSRPRRPARRGSPAPSPPPSRRGPARPGPGPLPSEAVGTVALPRSAPVRS
jgi:hypothetical protein